MVRQLEESDVMKGKNKKVYAVWLIGIIFAIIAVVFFIALCSYTVPDTDTDLPEQEEEQDEEDQPYNMTPELFKQKCIDSIDNPYCTMIFSASEKFCSVQERFPAWACTVDRSCTKGVSYRYPNEPNCGAWAASEWAKGYQDEDGVWHLK